MTLTTTTTEDLRTRAREALRRCGAELGGATSTTVTARSPITGEDLFAVRAVDRDGVLGAVAAAREAFRRVARRARTGARRPREALGGAADRAQGRHRRPHHDRGRQDPLRGARRGAGDDRHLRLRGRPVASARRPDDAVRAPGPPPHGDVAPARRRRRHQRLQLPGGGVELERRGRAGLWRHGRVEAVARGRADGDGVQRAARPGGRRVRRAAEPQRPRDRRRRCRTGDARQPATSRS